MESNAIENDVILEGYLKKWTNYLTGWRERYFTLKEGGILTFFDKQNGKDKGTIYLKIASIKLTPKDPLRITIHSGLKELNLRASSIIDKYRWVSALREAAYSTQESGGAINKSPYSNKRRGSQASIGGMNYSGHDTHSNTNFKKIAEFENQILGIINFLMDNTLPNESASQVVKLNAVFKEMMKAILEWKDAVAIENERLERMKEKLDNYFDGLDGVRVNVDDGLLKASFVDHEDKRHHSAIHKVGRADIVQTDSMGESSSDRYHSDVQANEKILSHIEPVEKKGDLYPVKELSPIPDVENESYQNAVLGRGASQKEERGDRTPKELRLEHVQSEKSKRSAIQSPEIKINGPSEQSRYAEEEKENKTARGGRNTLGNDVTEDESQFYSIVNPPISKIIREINNKTVEGGTMFQTVNEDDMQSFAQEEEVKFQNLDNPDLQVLQYLNNPAIEGGSKVIKTLNPQIETLLRDNPVFRDYVIPYSSKRTSFPFDIEPIAEQNWAWTEQKNSLDVPISFHEPLSFLQRLCEQFEYSEILDQADEADDSLLRMAHIIAFAISGYHTTSRRLTKPLDSLLGETYEFTSDDNDFQFVAEQTSAMPPVTSFYATSTHFELSGSLALKPEFLSKCIEVKTEGHSEVKLKKTGDAFIFSRPITSVDRIQSGKYCISNYGEVRFKNTKTQETAIVNLMKRGRDETKIHVLEGYIKNANGDSVYKVTGKWDEEIKVEHVETKEVKLIWKRKAIDSVDTNFGFSHFALQLNYLNKELLYQLPPTDSRFRPDIRALENGDYELAGAENRRLKEKQEKLVRSLMENNSSFKSKWFDVAKGEGESKDLYVFNQKYFDEKLKDTYENDLYNEDMGNSSIV